MTPLDLTRAADKLRLRGGLPGAFGYDRAADGFRTAKNRGVPIIDLLPAAMPASWMVNNRAPSPVFRRWLTSPLLEAWSSLLAMLQGGPDSWQGLGGPARDEVAATVVTLSIDGQGPCALSKVLALLVPETVPLMDDAAVARMTGLVDVPDTAERPRAPPDVFVPTLDAFSEAVLQHEETLIELARGYDLCPLDASQVLDRLIWFDSWGHRHFKELDDRASPAR